MIDYDSLEVDFTASLGTGGTASGVWRCRGSDGKSYLLKMYSVDEGRIIRAEALDMLVKWRTQDHDSDTQDVLRRSAWPREMVVDKNGVAGVLIPLAPTSFWRIVRGSLEPRTFTALTERSEDTEYRGTEYFPMPQKVARLGSLLQSLAAYHRAGVAVGDLHPNNLLTVGLVGTPTCYFLDCDSFVLGGQCAVDMLDPVLWKSPYAESFDFSTDLYKFALLCVRCLQENNAARSADKATLASVLNSRDIALLESVLNGSTRFTSAVALDVLGKAWSNCVGPDGTLYRRTDDYERQLWVPADAREMRAQSHFSNWGSSSGAEDSAQPEEPLEANLDPDPRRVTPSSAPSEVGGRQQLFRRAMVVLAFVILIVLIVYAKLTLSLPA